MKNIIALVIFSLLFVLGMGKVLAYDLTLTSVGSQSTLGVDYSVVNYTGGVPTLVGTASPSASVGININTVLNYTTASVSGVWQYIPSALNQGDNNVVITSGVQSISLTLRFNSTVSGTIATLSAIPDESSLPDAGVWQYYILVIIAGLGVFFLGNFGKKWMHKWERGD